MTKLNFIDYDVLIVDNIDDDKVKKSLLKITPLRRAFIITDENVYKLYEKDIKKILPDLSQVVIVPSGEVAKSFKVYQEVLEKLLEKNVSNEDILISFGGGVISDLTGFIAATLKRGVRYINIPTTIIGQTDASIGGKVGVNFKKYKNQVGAFYDPYLVITALDFLKTLPKDQIASGIGELFRVALLGSTSLYKKINSNFAITEDDVIEALNIKMSYVEKDYFDQAERNVLNLGHTFSHAIESFTNFKVPHGVAVLTGIKAVLKVGCKLGITKKSFADEVSKKIDSLKFKDVKEYKYKDLKQYILKDKKARDAGLNLVVLADFEKPAIINIPWEELDEVFS